MATKNYQIQIRTSLANILLALRRFAAAQRYRSPYESENIWITHRYFG